MAPPQFTYGAGNLSYDWTPDTINDLAEALKEAGINRVDSAAIYPFTDPGGSDRLLGIGKFPEKGFTVDTKAMVFGDGSGTMTEAAIEKSLSGSLEGLKIPKVNVFYCHSPDKQTPIAEQAAAMDAEYRKGRFSHLGICNIPTEMLEEWIQVAEQKGYVKPSIYQGQYNLLSRTYETTLFPLLEKHGISFAAFSPLASGFLTGKLTFSEGLEDLQGTKFEVSDTNFTGMRYRSFYDKPAMHEAIRRVAPTCEAHGISLGDASIRWLLYHSYLKDERGDNIIIGAKNLQQIGQYVAAKNAGPLPDEVVKALDGIWEDVKEEAKAIVQY